MGGGAKYGLNSARKGGKARKGKAFRNSPTHVGWVIPSGCTCYGKEEKSYLLLSNQNALAHLLRGRN